MTPRKITFAYQPLIVLILLMLATTASARSSLRGGYFVQYHMRDLSGFDSQIQGNPVSIGLMGCGLATKTFCIGLAGGMSLVTGDNNTSELSFFYGGLFLEFGLFPGFKANMLFGGGDLRVNRITLENASNRNLTKLTNEWIFLFHPSLSAEVQLMKRLTFSLSAGYLAATQNNLNSFTFGVNLFFTYP